MNHQLQTRALGRFLISVMGADWGHTGRMNQWNQNKIYISKKQKRHRNLSLLWMSPTDYALLDPISPTSCSPSQSSFPWHWWSQQPFISSPGLQFQTYFPLAQRTKLLSHSIMLEWEKRIVRHQPNWCKCQLWFKNSPIIGKLSFSLISSSWAPKGSRIIIYKSNHLQDLTVSTFQHAQLWSKYWFSALCFAFRLPALSDGVFQRWKPTTHP